MATQEDRLLEYLTANGNINPLEAWNQLGIYRLSAVIFNLRRKGFDISMNLIDVENRFKEKCHVAQYKFNEVHQS